MEELWVVLRTAVNCIFPLALIFTMTEFKCRRSVVRLSYLILTLFASLINLLILFFLGREIMMRWFAVITAVPSILLLSFLAKDRLSQLFFSFFTAINILYFVSILSRILIGMRGDLAMPETIFRALLFSAFLFLFSRYLSEPYHYIARHLRHGWAVISLLPFLFFALVMFFGLYPTVRTDNFIAVILLYLILCLVYFVIYQVFHSTYAQLSAEQEERLMEIQLSSLMDQLNVQNDNMEKMSVLRHDLRHLITNVTLLLNSGSTEEALTVLNSYSDGIAAASPKVYCANPILNALLSFYIDKASGEGIRVETDLDLPKELPVDVTKLSMVLSNAIENACNACSRMPVYSDKWLDLICICRPHFLLQISNTCSEAACFSKNGLPHTDQAGHGIGMKSIHSFIREYGAVYDCQSDGKVFTLRIMIPEGQSHSAFHPLKTAPMNIEIHKDGQF